MHKIPLQNPNIFLWLCAWKKPIVSEVSQGFILRRN